MIQRRRSRMTTKGLIVRWLLAPLALIADGLVTFLVTPFGYDSNVYDVYLNYTLRLKDNGELYKR